MSRFLPLNSAEECEENQDPLKFSSESDLNPWILTRKQTAEDFGLVRPAQPFSIELTCKGINSKEKRRLPVLYTERD